MPASFVLLPEPAALKSRLADALPGFGDIRWVESTGSTNADLYERARAQDSTALRPWLLGAHLQSRGRGRAGRTWQNRRGDNLMFSCAFDVFMPPARLAVLAPLAGLAAAESIQGLISPGQAIHLSMKWPNDIQWKSAKLAGILVEATRAGTARLAADHHVVIIGLGVNLNDARSLSQSMNRRIADWAEICAADHRASTADAGDLVIKIALGWQATLHDAIAQGLDGFPERYHALDALNGLQVDIQDQGRLLRTGIACGVNPAGQLLIRTPTGIEAISVGDVSVRAQA